MIVLLLSIIFLIFVLTLMIKVKSGLGEQPMELNQRQPAFIYNKGSPTFIYRNDLFIWI